MKWDCDAREERLSDWHRWFAWHPIKVAPHDCRWLEVIERKGRKITSWGEAFWCWEYRARTQEGGG